MILPHSLRTPSAVASDGTSCPPQCCACGKPIRVGDPRWAGDVDSRAWHYGCAERAGFTLSWNWLHRKTAPGVAG
jgi:hypothetical protein